MSDDEEPLADAIARGCEQADLVLLTGGLGPTRDDRTRHAIARACGVELRESAAAWKQIETFFYKRIGRKSVSASNRRQALLPHGAKPLKNDRGTAPGIVMTVAKPAAAKSLTAKTTVIVSMPGVPHEMKAMLARFEQKIGDYFPDLRVPVRQSLALAGTGESRVQDLLGDLLDGDAPRMGITAHEVGHILITAQGSKTAVNKRMAAIRKQMKPWLIQCENIAEELVRRLTGAGQTITTAESCTCGHIVSRLGPLLELQRSFVRGW